MEEFNPIPNKDAWSSIRGFVYQVELTIVRWLNLDDNQVLELEKGEDIDIVSKGIEGNEELRVLEQIKHRDSKISLNQKLVLEILFNFWQHIQNNPNKELLFRFVTNANYAIERPALFPKGESGVKMWEQLRSANAIDTESAIFKTIKEHLLKKIKEQIKGVNNGEDPTGIKNKQWIEFSAYLSSDESLKQIISNFEWAISSGNSDSLSETIKTKISKLNSELTAQEIDLLYPRLFTHIFRLLSIPGQKQLERQSLLELTSKKSIQLEFEVPEMITNILNRMDRRISAVENSVRSAGNAIATISERVTSIEKSDATFEYKLTRVPVHLPEAIKNGTLREEKVGSLLHLFNAHTWVNLQGINGTGKTQLAILLARKSTKAYWLDLRYFHRESHNAFLVVDAFLEIISGCPFENRRDSWLKDVFQKIEPGTILTLNDLPDVRTNVELTDNISTLIRIARQFGCKILTTSNYNIPRNLIQTLEPNTFFEYHDLTFTDDEIIEFLVNNDIHEDIAKYFNLLVAVTNRNPQLISSAIFHLKSVNWRENPEEILSILTKNFSQEILEDSQKAITAYLKDEQAKTLLYRLSLINWGMNGDLVARISKVETPISNHFEKLQIILNVWIQTQDDLYLNSPLIQDLGLKNLSEQEINDVYITTAKSILETKQLNQITASRCINLFSKAKEYNQVGSILWMMYQSADTIEKAKELEKWGYLFYLTHTNIPKSMAVTLRAMVRLQQIRLLTLLNQDPEALVAEMISYVEEDGIEHEQKVFLSFLTLSVQEPKKPKSYLTNLIFAIENWEYLAQQFDPLPIDKEMFVNLIWVPIQNMREQDDVKLWLKALDALQTKLNIDAYTADIASEALYILSNNISNTVNIKDEIPTNVEEIIDDLHSLQDHFEKKGYPELAAQFTRNIVYQTFKIKKTPNSAEALCLEYVKKYPSKVVIYDLFATLGKLYYDANNSEKSIEFLSQAVRQGCEKKPNYVDTLIYVGSAVAPEHPQEAVRYFEEAVQIAKKDEHFDDLDFIMIQAELGIAYWLNNQGQNSFEMFETVISDLMNVKNAKFGPKWIRLLIWTGHALGYISASLSSGDVPTKTADGGDYIKPYVGLISFNTKDISAHYKPQNDPIIYFHLAICADGLGNIEKAYEWSQKSFDLARQQGNDQVFMMVSSLSSQYSLLNFKIEEAFESSLLTAVVSVYLPGDPKERYKNFENIGLSKIFEDRPNEKWKSAEDTTVGFTIIPLFILTLNQLLQNAPDKQLKIDTFLSAIKNYIPKSADTFLWELVYEIMNKIINENITEKELIDRGNVFGNKDKRYLQFICYLGAIYISENPSTKILQVINIIPFFTKILRVHRSLVKFVLFPFVREIVKVAILTGQVNSETRDDVLTKIANLDGSNLHDIQLTLQPAVEIFKLNVEGSRKEWLYEFKEI